MKEVTDEQIERCANHAADRIPASNYIGRVIHAVRMALALAQPQQPDAAWVRIADRLPELHTSVALINVDEWENTGGNCDMNVRACGYLSDAGPFKYWSIRGERATALDAFTHWMPLTVPETA